MPTPADTTTIRIDRRTAEQLQAQAESLGLSLEAYLRGVAGAGPSPGEIGNAAPVAPATPDAVDRWLDDLSHGLPAAPSLPADFSRGDIYGEHD